MSAFALVMIAAPAAAQIGAPAVIPPAPPMRAQSEPTASRDAYRRPSYGWRLPSAWTTPTYYIEDYRAYGLRRPAPGYGWSWYYDDAVLTDRYGRVLDWREDAYREGSAGNDEHEYRDDEGRIYRGGDRGPHWDALPALGPNSYYDEATGEIVRTTTTTRTTPRVCN